MICISIIVTLLSAWKLNVFGSTIFMTEKHTNLLQLEVQIQVSTSISKTAEKITYHLAEDCSYYHIKLVSDLQVYILKQIHHLLHSNFEVAISLKKNSNKLSSHSNTGYHLLHVFCTLAF